MSPAGRGASRSRLGGSPCPWWSARGRCRRRTGIPAARRGRNVWAAPSRAQLLLPPRRRSLREGACRERPRAAFVNQESPGRWSPGRWRAAALRWHAWSVRMRGAHACVMIVARGDKARGFARDAEPATRVWRQTGASRDAMCSTHTSCELCDRAHIALGLPEARSTLPRRGTTHSRPRAAPGRWSHGRDSGPDAGRGAQRWPRPPAPRGGMAAVACVALCCWCAARSTSFVQTLHSRLRCDPAELGCCLHAAPPQGTQASQEEEQLVCFGKFRTQIVGIRYYTGSHTVGTNEASAG